MMRILQSLLIKLGMLAMTMGVVLWIGWRAPQMAVQPPVPVVQSEALPAFAMATPDDDKKQAVVPSSVGPAPSKPVAPAKAVQRDVRHRPGLVDLNRASVEDLESLPGLGPVLARRVVAYRQSAGKFQSVEDLRQVKGIGQKKLDRVRPLVTVAAPDKQRKTEKPPS